MKHPERFIVKGVKWFQPTIGGMVFGPKCIVCELDLKYQSVSYNSARCEKCDKLYQFDTSIQTLKNFAINTRTAAIISSTYDIVSYDTPPPKAKVKDSDDIYTMWANITQKEGKPLALLYISKTGDADKVQYFVDIDKKELRYDQHNLPPKELLAKVTVEFAEEAKITQEYKRK